jgi:16S rRNA (guanine966-N2)-methyltransferase
MIHQLRITGGSLRGRRLALQKDDRARYTSSKVRQAIFDLIGDITGFAVLDLFSGSGSFSAEALSRGSQSSTCVERDGEMVRLLGANLSSLSIDKDCLVLHMDVRYALRRLAKEGRRYDVVFLDPPYEAEYVKTTTAALAKHGLCREGGLIVIEHSKREHLGKIPHEWHLEKQRTYGDTVITVLRHLAEDEQVTQEVIL